MVHECIELYFLKQHFRRSLHEFPSARPFAAARKLLDIVRGSMAESKLPYAYAGATNTAFTQAGGSVDEYSIGTKHAAAQKWFEVNRSGKRIVLLADDAE